MSAVKAYPLGSVGPSPRPQHHRAARGPPMGTALLVANQPHRQRHAGGLTRRSVLEELKAIQMLDIKAPSTDGRCLTLTRTTQPDAAQQMILALRPDSRSPVAKVGLRSLYRTDRRALHRASPFRVAQGITRPRRWCSNSSDTRLRSNARLPDLVRGRCLPRRRGWQINLS